jgi:ABC-type dipeptide/oligopeptide/nickel transport system ATPase component
MGFQNPFAAPDPGETIGRIREPPLLAQRWQQRRIALPRGMPSPLAAPASCLFARRRAFQVESCGQERPVLSAASRQEVACFVRGG